MVEIAMQQAGDAVGLAAFRGRVAQIFAGGQKPGGDVAPGKLAMKTGGQPCKVAIRPPATLRLQAAIQGQRRERGHRHALPVDGVECTHGVPQYQQSLGTAVQALVVAELVLGALVAGDR